MGALRKHEDAGVGAARDHDEARPSWRWLPTRDRGRGGANGAVAVGPEPAIYPKMAPPTFTLDGPLADLGATAPVRKLAGHDVTAADLARIADALGMHGNRRCIQARLRAPRRRRDAHGRHDRQRHRRRLLEHRAVARPSVDRAALRRAHRPARRPAHRPASRRPPTDLPLPVPSRHPNRSRCRGPADADDPAAGRCSERRRRGRASRSRCSTTSACSPASSGRTRSKIPTPWCRRARPTRTARRQIASPVYSRTVTFQLVEGDAPVPGVSWSVTIGEHGHVDNSQRNVGAGAGRDRLPVANDREGVRSPEERERAVRERLSRRRGARDRRDARRRALGRHRRTPKPVAYLVPTYRFQIAGVDGARRYAEVLALDPASFKVAPNANLPVPEPALAGKEVEQ